MLNKETLKALTANFVGTFFIVLVSCLSFVLKDIDKLDMLGLALINSFVLISLSWAFQEFSHSFLNPNILLLKMSIKSSKIGRSILFLSIQAGASILATFIAVCLTTEGYPESFNRLTGYPVLNTKEYSDIQCFIFEFVGSSLYTFAYYATIVDKRGPKCVHGFALGSVVLLSTLVFGNATGGCVNLLRVLGPQVIFGDWSDVLVYWLGILFGGMFTGYYYEYFLLRNEELVDDLEEIYNGKTMRTVENLNQASTLKY